MASWTDYMVLSDGPFELNSKPGDNVADVKILKFTLPNDFTVGTNFARPILAFIINYRSDEGSVGIWVNTGFPLLSTTREQTLSWHNANHTDSGLWEAVQGTKFKAGKENQIIFGLQSGDKGHVRFRDVVLWYQRGSGT